MYSLKYLRSTTLVCKDIGIKKSEFVAKTRFLYINKYLSEWKKHEDLVNVPEKGRGVNGKNFEIAATKLFINLVPLSISPIIQGILFGLDILKTFNISLIFPPETLRVFQKEVI